MIQQKINHLASNEDEKQDMWVLYLEDPLVDFEEKLNKIRMLDEENDLILANILMYMQAPPTQDMLDILDIFTDLERGILILLILGMTKEQISKYKAIEMLRLKQLINTISTHTVWEKYFDKKKIKF